MVGGKRKAERLLAAIHRPRRAPRYVSRGNSADLSQSYPLEPGATVIEEDHVLKSIQAERILSASPCSFCFLRRKEEKAQLPPEKT